MADTNLSEEDLAELLKLTDEAQNTPVIAMSLKDGLEGRDLASLAWDRVRRKWDELGVKYGFNPRHVQGINRQTGEVLGGG